MGILFAIFLMFQQVNPPPGGGGGGLSMDRMCYRMQRDRSIQRVNDYCGDA
jgi:hypothetical protein